MSEPPGPAVVAAGRADDELAAWRDAAEAGGLPSPDRDRWQPLRSGVVNLWEFDVAEYWLAGGRAQFVGQNQSGKSTLMALTTLILLAGDLDRQLVDTFGQQHKAFRYYVEPTDDPQDRRDTGAATSRGWAWVEYGRLDGDGEPRYLTCLLYAQAKRGSNDFVRTWAVCDGPARVRAGLDLCQGAAVRSPSELDPAPGLRVARNGAEYKSWVSRDLFGFAEQSRLEAVVRMLKVLRTPHLGQRLDPDFFTAQMREALPAIAQSEIDELAEGWDQLDALAAEREHAETARDAVTSYLRRAWNPWADAVLRRHADDLAASVTGVDNVTRTVRTAEDILRAATGQAGVLGKHLKAARRELDRVEQNYADLLKSPAFQKAYNATAEVGRLKNDAIRARDTARLDAAAAGRAQAALGRRSQALALAEQKVTDATADMLAAVGGARAAAAASGLPAGALAWAQDGDAARLAAAVSERSQHLAATRRLLAEADRTRNGEEAAARLAAGTAAENARRREAAVRAEETLAEALQILSDDLESWAAALAEDAPGPARRSDWIAAVTQQSAQARPRAVLGQLLRETWLGPAVTPLRERAAVAEQEAGQLTVRAADCERQAALERAAPEPEPAAPGRWTRRDRPAIGPGGAPLWRLLDPRDGVPSGVLDRVEAALDAMGLLDAWVTPDGAWLAGRDGDDIVLTAVPGPARDALGPPPAGTLAAVLAPAADAGSLSARVAAVLVAIGYQPDGRPAAQAYSLSADGRWRGPAAAGRAAPAEHGAELIGTAARAAARDRRARDLEAEAARLRQQAAGLREAAAGLRSRAGSHEAAAARAPADAEAVRTGLAVGNAHLELEKARDEDQKAQRALDQARTVARDASAALLTYAGDHSVPVTAPAQDELAAALHGAASAIGDLRLAAAGLQTAQDTAQSHRELHREAEESAVTASESADKAARRADRAQDIADNAEETLGQSEKDLLEAAEQQEGRRDELKVDIERLQGEWADHRGQEIKAQERLNAAGQQRLAAEQARDVALAAWWIPVDAGLAAARSLPAEGGRTLTHAVAQARAARDTLRPRDWPDGADAAAAAKAVRADSAWTRAAGSHLVELRAILEASGGRGAAVLDAEEPGRLPAITILVDSTGEQSDPVRAVTRLDEQVRALTDLHDQKMHEVLIELLSSTFVEHLRERLATVLDLLRGVNQVLARHPTGASSTTLRLRRMPADRQGMAFRVLQALETEFIDSRQVQDQVRAFLEQQIREAQDQGRSGASDWKQHLAVALDYRRWFDIVTEYRVGDAPWRPLTKEVHAKDSGGGKVVTLLQPLVATLVALYEESGSAPRPLWLDEAFTGVDDTNRATMLALLVTFDLDFLLAGPGALVTTAQVPSAAVWFINRAPAPEPGVDLSLMLWAGNALMQVDTDLLAVPAIPAPRPAVAAAPPAFPEGEPLSLFDASQPVPS